VFTINSTVIGIKEFCMLTGDKSHSKEAKNNNATFLATKIFI
jgi:hypothetical protein